MTGALEIERRAKTIGSSLEAAPKVYISDPELAAAVDGLDLAEIVIASDVSLVRETAPQGAFALDDVPDVGVVFERAQGMKCERCWMILPDVNSVPGVPQTCRRCAAAVGDRLATDG